MPAATTAVQLVVKTGTSATAVVTGCCDPYGSLPTWDNS